jgi:hypothetical protein
MSSTLSIYIPRMAAHHDEESIINVMTNYGIGTVSHVDFTTVNKQPGFVENVDNYMKSAFVHFSDPMMSSSDNNYHYNSRRTLGNENFWNIVLYRDGPYKLQISLGEYWLCLENTNPVQRTLMNVHQIVENGRYLEKLIEEQSQTIKKLENKLEGLHNVVYQLVGGLFNHQTQAGIMAIHHHIMGFNNCASIHNDTSKWEISPTTLQGDENERRIESLEQTVRDMLNYDCPEAVFTPQEDDEEQDELLQKRKYEEIDDCSVSTHSSMPELEEASVDSEQRIRNSFELCGNE